MNYKNLMLCFLGAFSFSCQSGENIQSVSVNEFADYLLQPEVQCLDVRTPAEYFDGHIVGSLNVNVQNEAFNHMTDSLLDKTKPVAVYCRSGKRSKKAAKILSKRGYQVIELDKGFNSWTKAGKEIEK